MGTAQVRIDLGGRIFTQKIDLKIGAQVKTIPLGFAVRSNANPVAKFRFENGLELRPFGMLETDPLRLHDSWSVSQEVRGSMIKLGLKDVSPQVVALSKAMPSLLIDMDSFIGYYPGFTFLTGYVPEKEEGLKDLVSGLLPLGFNLLLLEGSVPHDTSNVAVRTLMRSGMKFLLTNRAVLDIKTGVSLRSDARAEAAPLSPAEIINAAVKHVIWKGIFEQVRLIPQMPEEDEETEVGLAQIG